MRTKRLAIILTFLTTAALVGGAARAQEWHQGRARLEGTVTSAAGQPLAGATVALRYQGSGPDLKTDKKGHWAMLGLVVVSWDADLSAPAYQPRKISVALSEVNLNQPVNLAL